jgi:hypothetical protein
MDLDSFSAGRKPLFPATFVDEAVFSLLYVFGAFVKNKVGIAVWIHIWVLYSVPLIFMSIFVQVPCCFYAIALYYSLKLGIVIPPALVFLLSIALAI